MLMLALTAHHWVKIASLTDSAKINSRQIIHFVGKLKANYHVACHDVRIVPFQNIKPYL